MPQLQTGRGSTLFCSAADGIGSIPTLVNISQMNTAKDGLLPKPITLVVTSISKVAKTKKGSRMQFATVKDQMSEKNTLILYHHLEKLKPFHIYKMTKVYL